MAIYAIGDIQGCFDELRALLVQIAFDPQRDCLWICGDLVNRGPRSLEVLRFVRNLGDRAVVVLGNHDLHLLAVAAGKQTLHPKDTLQEVLSAPDCGLNLAWLRTRPLLHHDQALGFTMIHAGLPPAWDLATAQACAREVEAVLAGPDYPAFFQEMYGDRPDRWSPHLEGYARLRFITNCLTRLRYCDTKGRLALKEKGPPGTQSPGFLPWFEVPGRRSLGERILFGHWATLRINGDPDHSYGVYHLDTGCAWGGRMTALRLEDERYFSVPCQRFSPPARVFQKRAAG
jgi:bis(5'-nucleosyl)-tetraphosphatase (symmetrical)